MTKERLKFIHTITEGRLFYFGVMVFDQIYKLGQQAIAGETNKLLLPDLIQHILDTQHLIPVHGGDTEPKALNKMVWDFEQRLPKKPPRTRSANYSYTKDMGRPHRLLDTIASRAASKCSRLTML